jgi:hypothetical protein
MKLDALIGEIVAIQSKVENLDILDPEWKATMRTEVRLAAELRALILSSPILATDNPALKKLLPDIQVAHGRDPYTSGLELLFGVVRQEEYIATLLRSLSYYPPAHAFQNISLPLSRKPGNVMPYANSPLCNLSVGRYSKPPSMKSAY